MNSAAPKLPQLDLASLEALRARYGGVDAPEVLEHLTAHPELVPVLIEAEPHLRDAFGGDVVLRLEPPFFAGDELFARVYGHGLDVDGVHERTERFWRWWLAVEPARDAARRWLEFGVGWGE